MNKKRESNFELLRVVCMVMVIVIHTVLHGQAFDNTYLNSFNFIAINLLRSLSIVAVNCYVLIAGFYGINAKYNFKKVIQIYAQVLFYSITISLLFWITKVEAISVRGIISTIFPIIMNVWWFITTYLVLYVLSPFINKLIKALSFEEYNKLLLYLTIVFVICSSLIFIYNPIDTSGGYGLYNFIYLYMIGAYIKLYFKEKKIKKSISISLYFLSLIMLAGLNVIVSIVKNEVWGIYSYNFILVIIGSVSLFLFFKELKIESRLINRIASFAFGVYLFHDHPYIRASIYNFLNYNNSFNTKGFILYTIVVVIIIFILSCIVEYIRQLLFKYFCLVIRNGG